MNGNRPESINEIENNQMKMLIEKCWNQKSDERLEINKIVNVLKNELIGFV